MPTDKYDGTQAPYKIFVWNVPVLDYFSFVLLLVFTAFNLLLYCQAGIRVDRV